VDLRVKRSFPPTDHFTDRSQVPPPQFEPLLSSFAAAVLGSVFTQLEVSMSHFSSVENDLRAIEAVNKRDVQYALANDAAMMMSQWTDDFVLLPSDGPIMRGRSVIADAFRGAESPQILDYVLDIQEVRVLGDHAFQWGTYHYSMRPRSGGGTIHTSGKLMRILQRQPDGSWKIHRGIATADPPTP
jgi:uncharacterized protein (TIGR02246 family)